jgi:hypothetical protein
MTSRIPLVALLFTATLACASPDPIRDDLATAYYAAERDLQNGKDRQEIADRLKPVVEKYPKSVYYHLASTFLTDLRDSIGDIPKDAGPEQRLAETRILLWDIQRSENWPGGEKPFLKADPKDPAYQLLTKDRAIIEKLIPLLTNRAPTRSDNSRNLGGAIGSGMIPQARVCDVALAIIEYHAVCRFFRDSHSLSVFQQQSADRRDKVIQRVRDWWAENKDKSVAAGMRAQFPHAGSYPEKVWMAKALVRVGEGQKTDDKEHGLKLLRDMLKHNPGHVAAYVADAMAEVGDLSAVDVFYDALKSSGARSCEPHVVWYLCKHGQRREWELLAEMATAEVARGNASRGEQPVWMSVAGSGVAAKNPYAIPILPLGLSHENRITSEPLQWAEQSLRLLQKHVGQDFGYKANAPEDDRRAALRKGQEWWQSEGKAKYTFDYIEKNLLPAKPGGK